MHDLRGHRQMAGQDQRRTTQEDEPGRIVGVVPTDLAIETGPIKEFGLLHKPKREVW